MKELNVCGVKALLLLTCFVFWGTSCISEKYDMSGDNLNLEVTPFQEGLELPLGSTDSIKLADLLKGVSADILDTTKNYMIRVADSMDLSENLPSLTEMLDIEDITFDEKVSFKLDNVDVSAIRIDEQRMTFEHEMSSAVSIPTMPGINVDKSITINAGLDKYAPNPDNLKVNFTVEPKSKDIMSINTSAIRQALSLAGISSSSTTPVPMSDYVGKGIDMSLGFGPYNFPLPLNLSLPEGITSVDQILLNENAAIKISVSLEQGILSDGDIIPDFDLDLSEVFNIRNDADAVINLKDHLTLNKGNNYSASHTIGISSLAIDGEDWTNNGTGLRLNKNFNVSLEGEVKHENLKTTPKLLTDETKSKMKITFSLSFVDLTIEGIDATIKDIEIPNHSEISLDIADITVPKEIEKISYLKFGADDGLSLNIQAQNLGKINGLNATLKTLDITFPEWLEVEGADEDNKISVVADENLSAAINKKVKVNGIKLPDPVNGVISLSDGDIVVDAVATAGGSVNTANLPEDASNDVKLVVKIISDIEVDDYEIHMNDYSYELDIPKKEIEVLIDNPAVADLGEIVIYPEQVDGKNPVLTINMDLPDVGSLKLRPMVGEGLKIAFPKLLVFSSVPSSYNYDPQANTIHFTNDQEIPEAIELPISKLVIVPELNNADGKYYARGAVEITGGITLAKGVLHEADVEAITAPDQKVSVEAVIPKLVPSTLSLDNFHTRINKSVDLNILSPGSMPKELVEINEIKLDGTTINLGMKVDGAEGLAEAGLKLDAVITLPEFVKVKDVEGSVLNLTGTLDKNNQLSFEPIEIDALDLSEVDLEKGISGKVNVDVDVTMSKADLDLDEWLSKDLEVAIEGGVKNIKVATAKAKVDYQLDMEPQKVDLSQFTDALGDMGMDAKLAFNHAHIALEVATNLGVPLNAAMNLIPYYDNEAGQAIEAKLNIQTSADGKPVKLWIADDNGDTRMPAGYTLVPVNGLLDLFSNIPDRLEIAITGGTDPTKECSLNLGEELALEINYAFELPLEFGEGFEVTYKTQISNLPEIVGEVLSSGLKVKLMGKVMNALPLGLDLKFNFLDADGNPVQLVEGAGRQEIKACGYEASSGVVTASETPLAVVLGVKDPKKAKDIKSLELEFNANSEGAVGVPVTKDAHLQAVLQLSLPEGITVDLKELMNNKNEK